MGQQQRFAPLRVVDGRAASDARWPFPAQYLHVASSLGGTGAVAKQTGAPQNNSCIGEGKGAEEEDQRIETTYRDRVTNCTPAVPELGDSTGGCTGRQSLPVGVTQVYHVDGQARLPERSEPFR
jgi:hypothetical protein